MQNQPKTQAEAARETPHERTERVQSALYRIAEAASSVQDMQEFYAAMHDIVGELMYARNFSLRFMTRQPRKSVSLIMRMKTTRLRRLARRAKDKRNT